MTLGRTKKLHFVGIGGSGMSGIAEILLTMGYAVSGSDLAESATVKHLRDAGAEITIGHNAANVGEAEVVVISTAVKQDNPEVVEAKERMIPVIPRAEMLAELMRVKYTVAVGGSHGKTTTTSMAAAMLQKGSFDPTIIIGGRLDRLGSGARLGGGDYLVAEADESDGTFLRLNATIAVITNIDAEHLDYYGSFNNVKTAFVEFANKVPFYGAAVLCLDDENVREMIPLLRKRYLTFGVTSSADVVARDIVYAGFTSSFTVVAHGEEIGRVSIGMPGAHNVYNALAAITVGLWLEMEPTDTLAALDQFSGIERRLQHKGDVDGVTVLDDYAHHPSEIKATLRGVREGFGGRRMRVVFEPHRYSRTRDQMSEFHTSFYDTDELIITDIYPAGEPPIAGITAAKVAEGVMAHGKKGVSYLPTLDDALHRLVETAEPGDIILTLGAGAITRLSDRLVAALKKRGGR